MTDDGIRRISLLDLTIDQVESIEKRVGVAAQHWGDAPSQGALLKAVYSIATGIAEADVGAMTLRDLQSKVDLSGDEDQDPSQPT